MYNLVTTFSRSYDNSIGVRELSGADLKIRDLVSQSSELYLVLTSPYLDGEQLLNIKDALQHIYNRSADLTVVQWLVALGNVTLPTTKGTIELTTHSVKGMDAFVSGYVVNPSTGFLSNDTDDVLMDDKPDISLVRADFNHQNMKDYVLASVNGYLHLTDSDNYAFYIKDAIETIKIGKSPKVTLYSFDNISKVQLVPMNRCDITPRVGIDLAGGLTITTDQDLTNKTVWLSVGGYLLHLNRDYLIANERSIHLNWDRFDFKNKYLEAKRHLDLTTLDVLMGFDKTSNGILDEGVLNSNGVINAFLNLPQSFLIIIDDPSVKSELTRLEDTGLPGKYLTYHNPHVMYVHENGNLPPVSLINEQKAWVVSTSIANSYVREHLYQTHSNENPVYTNAVIKARPKHRAALYRLDITTTKMTITT